MWTVSFWAQLGERAIKTFAQAALGAAGVGFLGVIEVPWLQVISVGALSAVLSVLSSIASGAVDTGDPVRTPSLVPLTGQRPAP